MTERTLSAVIAAAAAAAATTLAVSSLAAASHGAPHAWRAAASGADVVLTGTVSGLESRWAGKRIVTVADVAVERTVKGRAEGSVRVSVMGGRVERPVPVAMLVPDAPTLAEGEEALFFLRNAGDGTFTVSATLPVLRDPATGAKRVSLGDRDVPVEALEKMRRAAEERAAKTPLESGRKRR